MAISISRRALLRSIRNSHILHATLRVRAHAAEPHANCQTCRFSDHSGGLICLWLCLHARKPEKLQKNTYVLAAQFSQSILLNLSVNSLFQYKITNAS